MQTNRTGLSIVENGTDRMNNRIFTVQADHIELVEVLKTFFKRAGAEVAIDQDVSGHVDLSIKNVTFREALQWIVQVARPQIKVTKGKNDSIYHVSRDFEAQKTADEIARKIENLGGLSRGGITTPYIPGIVPPNLTRVNQGSLTGNVPNDRMVTLEVPEDKPIPLSEALSRISSQAKFPIFVDRRVPRELSFTGTISEAPLPLVLQTIASTTGLKLLTSGTQATFVPTDQFTIRVNDMLLGQYPNIQCSKCSQLISGLWSFCPHCGQQTPRGVQLSNQRKPLNNLRTGQPTDTSVSPNRKP